MGPTASTEMTCNQENNRKAGKTKDRATKRGIRYNALTDFAGIVVFTGTLRKKLIINFDEPKCLKDFVFTTSV